MNQRLEQYLGNAEQKLQSLPPTRRYEEIEEMRQHLVASIQAHQEMGLGTDAATTETLRQFGVAQQVGQSLQRVWWREQVGGPHGLWKTVALAIGLKYAVYGLLSPVTEVAHHVAQKVTASPVFHYPSTASVPLTLLSLWYLMPCIVAGALLAKLSPRNAIIGGIAGGIITILSASLNLGAIFTFGSDSLKSVITPNALWAMMLLAPVQSLVMVLAAWFTVRSSRKRLTLAQK